MQNAPHWTEAEFRQLLAGDHLTAEALGTEIGRSAGAVEVVRVGVQKWRTGQDHHDILSQMMIRVLEGMPR